MIKYPSNWELKDETKYHICIYNICASYHVLRIASTTTTKIMSTNMLTCAIMTPYVNTCHLVNMEKSPPSHAFDPPSLYSADPRQSERIWWSSRICTKRCVWVKKSVAFNFTYGSAPRGYIPKPKDMEKILKTPQDTFVDRYFKGDIV